jgi:hypothetical protein
LTQRFFRVLWMLFLFELGIVLICIPWLNLWDSNYFLNHYPMLRPYLLHPSVRGFVTGLGALDIAMAVSMLRHPSATSETPST